MMPVIQLLRLIPGLVTLVLELKKHIGGQGDEEKRRRLRALRRAIKRDPERARALVDAMIDE
jgi:hypothetical protein